MKYGTKLALQIFSLGIVIILIVFIVFNNQNHKNIINRELQHSISNAEVVSVNFEQRLLEKVKTSRTLSISTIFKNALQASNNSYGKLLKFPCF
ncbi:MAG: hypothetical protein KAS71_11325, partial [Bacteroidales bacterium]|nr:hypothetical protein [Bacteroidales bacterium]